jgi:pimeloyl-ACP methyl ester carboxylesterase
VNVTAQSPIAARPVATVATVAALALLVACAPAFQAAPLKTEGTVRKFVEIDGFRLHYDDRGQGAPVLFLHGFSSFLQAWDGVAGDLQNSFRVIQLDLPGHGQSDRRPADYTPAGVARTVRAFLDALHVDRVTVVAHSWGCGVALALALEAPDRVERLVLVDGWVFDDQANLFMRWSRAKGLGEALWNQFYDQHVELRYGMAFQEPERHMDERAFAAVKRYMAYPGSEAAALAIIRGLADLKAQQARYGQVRQPTQLIWCRDDEVARLPYGDRLADTLPDARIEVLRGCNHMPMIEQPVRFQSVLRRFLLGDEPLPMAAPPARPDSRPDPSRGGRP